MAQVLRPLQHTFQAADFPNLLVGLDAPDDAAIYQLNDQQAIISTVDFFPPVVDNPYAFGLIAAANALSDIYAMGATLFYLLTGQDPEPITQSRVRETQADVSETMDGVIQKCTAADCKSRYASVAEIATELSLNFGSSAPATENGEEEIQTITIVEKDVIKVDAMNDAIKVDA